MKVEITYQFDINNYKLDNAIFEITASVSTFIPAQTCGPPEACSPAEGGEIEYIEVKCINEDYNAEKQLMCEKELNRLLDNDEKLRETIETLLFEKAQSYEDDYEDWLI